MNLYEVKCITIMEETFKVWADDEKQAKIIIDDVLEDPDDLLIE